MENTLTNQMSSPDIPPEKPQNQIQTFFKRLLKNKLLLIGIMIIIVLILLGSISIILSSKPTENSSLQESKIIPTSNLTITPEPSFTPTEIPRQIIISSPTVKPTVILLTSTPQPTSPPPSPTSTPKPQDTTAPTLDYMTGPENGSTVDFNNFCFPMKASDNQSSSSSIQTRYKFDSSDWSSWSNNYSYCFNGVSNGSHSFTLEFKDEAGNTSSVSRTFTVQVP